jgi:cell division septation protein DedD
VRDYSEKRGASREPIEPRKPIAKNRPRKESGGMLGVLLVFAFLCTFGAGVFTGWFAFKGTHKAAPAPVAQAVKKEDPAPAAAPPSADLPLSFYKTLPAGGKGVIGTGLNLKKPEPALSAPHHPQAPATAPAAEPAEEPAAAPAAAAPAATPAAAAKPETSVRYVVQVASYREKQEALTAQGKLAGKGIAAYLVESKLADKGIWYRIRVGRHLTKGEAGELAAKSGKGSIVLPE